MDLLTASVAAAGSRGRPYMLAALAGEIDVTSSGGVRDLLAAAVAGGARVLVVDMSGVGFMDSSGLGALLRVARMLRRRGGTLGVVSPQGAVAVVLRLCAAGRLLPVCGSVAGAAGG